MEEFSPNPPSDDDHYLSVEFIETEFDLSAADPETEEKEVVHIPWHEEFKFQEEVLHATDTITFDRVFTKRARPTRHSPQTRKGLERLVTPWGVGALCCFLIANGLLTWSQFSSAPNSPGIASQALPSLNPKLLTKDHAFLLNLANSESLNLDSLSHLPPNSLKPRPVIAHLPVASPTVAIPATVPASVAIPPLANNSLTDALLPPSLQLHMPYAPSASPRLAPVPNQPPPRAFIPKFTVVNPSSVPTVAVNPAYTAPRSVNPAYTTPRSITTIPLPPPPPAPTALIQTPTAPPVSNNSSPVISTVDAPNSSLSDQISRQIANQERLMETNTSSTVTEGFNQKTRKELQNLYNQSQGGSATSEPDSVRMNSLVQELQQLNQPE